MSIAVTTVILFVVFGVLLFLGVPISVSIIASSIVTAMSTLSWDQITFITMQKMNSGVESFSLLAVPLFILAGNIMNNGGIAKRLINFAQIFVGKIPGNLAQANILAIRRTDPPRHRGRFRGRLARRFARQPLAPLRLVRGLRRRVYPLGRGSRKAHGAR